MNIFLGLMSCILLAATLYYCVCEMGYRKGGLIYDIAKEIFNNGLIKFLDERDNIDMKKHEDAMNEYRKRNNNLMSKLNRDEHIQNEDIK